MATLSTADKERIYWHCALNDAVYDGDRIIVAQRVAAPWSEFAVSKIRAILDACDLAEKALLELTTVSKQQLVSGDVNRSIVDFEANRRIAQGRYIAQCDLLAQGLGIPNYRRLDGPVTMRGRDSTYVTRIATPDGTSVGARLYLSDHY